MGKQESTRCVNRRDEQRGPTSGHPVARHSGFDRRQHRRDGMGLVMSIFVICIGLPLFVNGLAVVEVALRSPLSTRSDRGG